MLQRYFCEYLVSQRDLSPQTIDSYRDMFRLLLAFMERRYRIKPDMVCVDDLDAPRVLTFLDDLERRRGNTAHCAMLGERRFVHSFVTRRRPIPCSCQWHSECWQFLPNDSSELPSAT